VLPYCKYPAGRWIPVFRLLLVPAQEPRGPSSEMGGGRGCDGLPVSWAKNRNVELIWPVLISSIPNLVLDFFTSGLTEIYRISYLLN
jgi:hypothetical protein